jgi:hypothetical protein
MSLAEGGFPDRNSSQKRCRVSTEEEMNSSYIDKQSPKLTNRYAPTKGMAISPENPSLDTLQHALFFIYVK